VVFLEGSIAGKKIIASRIKERGEEAQSTDIYNAWIVISNGSLRIHLNFFGPGEAERSANPEGEDLKEITDFLKAALFS